jgi:hypothetical protein
VSIATPHPLVEDRRVEDRLHRRRPKEIESLRDPMLGDRLQVLLVGLRPSEVVGDQPVDEPEATKHSLHLASPCQRERRLLA